MNEFELEALPEYEWEWEAEGEYESEEFFRRLARQAVQSPALRPLRRIATAAARTARAAALAVRIANLARNPLPEPALPLPPPPIADIRRRDSGAASGPPSREYEGEFENEYEYEYEINPIRRVYPEALMEHLGHAAAQARTEAEAEAFIGALVPLAARIIPRAAPALMRVAPQLIQGVAGATRVLRRNPATRPLVRTLPTVVRRTAAQLARQSAQGRPITPQAAARTLAQQTARVIGSPRQATQAYRRSCALDRQYHQRAT
ncbi:MAG: hypothetical protein ACOYNY_04150 [Caldilineaceae bacterium]